MMGTAAPPRVGLPADARASRPAESPAGQSDGFMVALGAATNAGRSAARQAGAEAEPGEVAAESPPTALPLMQLLLPATPAATTQVGDGQHMPLAASDATNPGAQQLVEGEQADASRLAEQLESTLQFEVAIADSAAAASESDRATGDAANGLLRQLLQPAAAMLQGSATDPRLATQGGELPGATASVVAGPALPAQPTSVAAASGALPAGDPGLRQLVGSPRWAEELGSRLVMMSVRGQHEGSLSLAPEHLGPLEVRINMSQGSTHVWFGAQHADTRAALAEALPRLREMFAEAGLSLGQAGVSQEAPRREAATGSASGAARTDDPVDVPSTSPAPARRLSSALLDIYA